MRLPIRRATVRLEMATRFRDAEIQTSSTACIDIRTQTASYERDSHHRYRKCAHNSNAV